MHRQTDQISYTHRFRTLKFFGLRKRQGAVKIGRKAFTCAVHQTGSRLTCLQHNCNAWNHSKRHAARSTQRATCSSRQRKTSLPLANKYGPLGRCVQCPYISASYNFSGGTMLSIAEQGYEKQKARNREQYEACRPQLQHVEAQQSACSLHHAVRNTRQAACSTSPFPCNFWPAQSQHNNHAARAFLIVPIHSLGKSEARPARQSPPLSVRLHRLATHLIPAPRSQVSLLKPLHAY